MWPKAPPCAFRRLGYVVPTHPPPLPLHRYPTQRKPKCCHYVSAAFPVGAPTPCPPMPSQRRNTEQKLTRRHAVLRRTTKQHLRNWEGNCICFLACAHSRAETRWKEKAERSGSRTSFRELRNQKWAAATKQWIVLFKKTAANAMEGL